MIYFVRHGQSVYNAKKIFAGQKDVPLNETGILQAKETAKQLKDVKFDVCFCSPLSRARQTCMEILEYHKNLDIIFDDRLKERDYGLLVDKHISFVDFNRWKYDENSEYDKKYKIETVVSVYERVKSFLDEILDKYKDKNILIVAHSGIGRATYAYFHGLEDGFDFSKVLITNAQFLTFDEKSV